MINNNYYRVKFFNKNLTYFGDGIAMQINGIQIWKIEQNLNKNSKIVTS